ncbi:MAG: methionine biosynthesis protein MetW, partial [Gammaproteobacteria bacterium]|nr:methionine biosynthesis protein MetW [Gammaproteobacteria bacterium]
MKDLTQIIIDMIPFGSRVLDLGCGNGDQLALLKKQKQCIGYGIELDASKVLSCLQNGIQVLQMDLDKGLSMFMDK